MKLLNKIINWFKKKPKELTEQQLILREIRELRLAASRLPTYKTPAGHITIRQGMLNRIKELEQHEANSKKD